VFIEEIPYETPGLNARTSSPLTVTESSASSSRSWIFWVVCDAADDETVTMPEERASFETLRRPGSSVSPSWM